MSFSDNLQQLPSIAHIAELQLIAANGTIAATIPNIPGKAGSVSVYHALFSKYGAINAEAAQEGLQLFAEHTADAKTHPGSHPNIDRLLDIVATGNGYRVNLITV